MDRRAQIDADHADRRQPTQAEARTDLRAIVDAAEGIAGIDERSHAPVAREIVLDLAAGHQQAGAADHPVIAVARTDRLVAVTAHRAITTGEETQLRRQCDEVVAPCVAGAAAQDQPVALLRTERANPFRIGGELAEAGIGQQRAGGAARAQGERPAATRERRVVDLLARQRGLAEHQRAVAVFDAWRIVRLVAVLADRERAGQRMHAQRARPAMP